MTDTVEKQTAAMLVGAAVRVEATGPVLGPSVMSSPASGEITIAVAALGLCRTDLSVVSGAIATDGSIVPGHEFAGTVALVGALVEDFEVGDHVVVNPILPCGLCAYCADARPDICQSPTMLGVDHDGACADYVTVPRSAVYRIPDDLPFTVAAFAEPVAASLAVVDADVTLCAPDGLEHLPPDTFDFAIETVATTTTINQLIQLLRPKGVLVLKSRQHTPVQLTIADLLPKQLRMQAVNYGSFEQAISLLASGAVEVGDLIGPTFELDDFEAAFACAAGEQVKVFIAAPTNN